MSRKDRRHDPETAARVTSIIEAAERAAAALIDKADANAKRYLAEAEAEMNRAAAARLQALVETADALTAQADAIRRESHRLLESLRHTDLGRPGGRPAQPAPPAQQGGATAQSAAAAAPGLQQAVAGQPPGPEDLQPGQRGKHLAAVPGPDPALEPSAWPAPDPALAQAGGAAANDPGAPAPTPAAGSAIAGRPAPAQPYASNGQPQRSDGAAGARLLATQMAVSGSSREEIAARLRSGFQIEDPTPILDAILGPED